MFLSYIQRRFRAPGGYLEFLKIAVPLIISTGISGGQLFINRTFLSWYSQESFAASVPAGITHFAVVSLFLGSIAYVDVFVAQYYGRGQYRSIGPAIWQSVYLSIGAAAIMFVLSFFADSFFMNIGHPDIVARQEAILFKFLCYGAFPGLACSGLFGFYAGRGKTRTILFISLFGVIMNIVFDYLLIFGNFGFPELGIVGAAFASIISSAFMFILCICLITSKDNAATFNTRRIFPDFSFMKRLLRFGFPNGVQFFFDMAGFGIFVLIIGTLGIVELTASNIVLSINNLVIMPLIGCAITTSIMVGKYLGENKSALAQKSVMSAAQMVYAYIAVIIALLLIAPNYLIVPFVGEAHAAAMEQTSPVAINLLKILAAYLIFDSSNIIFAAAIKGAGDTAFVMKVLIVLSIVLVVIPTYLIVIEFKLGLYAAWAFMILYIAALAGIFFFRYKSNKWKKMRVIEMEIVED